MTQRFRFDIIWRFLFRSPRWIGENPFVGFLLLLFIALLISSFVFYQYVLVARNEDVESEITQVQFNQHAFREIIQIWQARAEKFNQAGNTQIRNIFGPAQVQELTEQDFSL